MAPKTGLHGPVARPLCWVRPLLDNSFLLPDHTLHPGAFRFSTLLVHY